MSQAAAAMHGDVEVEMRYLDPRAKGNAQAASSRPEPGGARADSVGVVSLSVAMSSCRGWLLLCCCRAHSFQHDGHAHFQQRSHSKCGVFVHVGSLWLFAHVRDHYRRHTCSVQLPCAACRM